MPDAPRPDPAAAPNDSAWNAVPALISFAFMALWFVLQIGVFAIIFTGVKVEVVMLTIIGGEEAAANTLLAAVAAYWLAASIGTKRSNAALAKMAGAGDPAPSAPGSPAGGDS